MYVRARVVHARGKRREQNFYNQNRDSNPALGLYKIRHSLYRSARRGVANGSAASIRILRFCGIYSAGMAGRQREAVIKSLSLFNQSTQHARAQKHKTQNGCISRLSRDAPHKHTRLQSRLQLL
jgi:hypothetical protein